MKLYPKQFVCPHCGTIYRYADSKRLVWKKQEKCYHCKKQFKISRKSIWLLALEALIVYAALNSIAIGAIGSVNFIALFIINLIPAALATMLFPFYIEFKKTDNKDKK